MPIKYAVIFDKDFIYAMYKINFIQLLCVLMLAVSGSVTAVAADFYKVSDRVLSAETGEPLDMAMVKLNTLDWH